MASFIPSKKEATDFNNGVQYINGVDALQAETVNNLVESALYTQQVVEDNTTAITTGVAEAKSIADSAVDIANDALDQVQDALSGGVTSVNGETGAVTVTPEKIGALSNLYRHEITYSNQDLSFRAELSFTIYSTNSKNVTNISDLYDICNGSKICGISGRAGSNNPLYIYFGSNSTAYCTTVTSSLITSNVRLYDSWYSQEDEEYNDCLLDTVIQM